MKSILTFVAGALAALASPAWAQEGGQYTPSPEEVERIAAELPQLMLHPLFDEPYVCSEHPYSTNMHLGDALGQDCLIVDGIDWKSNSGFMTYYVGDGSRNEDWHGWGKPVFAPASGTVNEVHFNETTNVPGTMIPGLATSVSILDDAGNTYVIAHLGEVDVETGQVVSAGDRIGTVGNNGNSRSPHIHVGAINAEGKPAQIRWNLVSAALRARDYIFRLRAADGAEETSSAD